ncbi:class I SAM-dependent methyltransferase [Streptomonospora nanhaiensis]|uniref:SAM-dependent methyltransferase n=1 Tax=Streptomonospora nanhaiensis TaxID=1323731 RepID=A0A853BNA0_9ACTN|nr:class I SAM-dependent methyltransferase [Streptomonospora nanhaiensis]MBX9389443.1 class I SAM-dependent methyltransferase [Streptomonospora nanhaiensis]NYI95932.1 SAM-dependent methyltransferase [Streptomonospora nanhaiensis]
MASDTLDPGLHCLRAGYTQRVPPEYFVDADDDGVTWQPDVYPLVLDLAREHGRTAVIDLGCGRAGKLAALGEQDPGLELVGVDYGPNIAWCRENLPRGRWVEADLETAAALPISPGTAARSVVVCSDVLEHLVDPRPAMRLICRLLDQGAACAVVSTPARDLRAGTAHPGPPRNPSHVREWAQDEFRAFLGGFPVAVERAGLTRSDDRDGGLTTQLVVLGPAAPGAAAGARGTEARAR